MKIKIGSRPLNSEIKSVSNSFRKPVYRDIKALNGGILPTGDLLI